MLPPYNVFSPDGDVTGQLVYVNYGLLEDYEQLERYGVDVAGKIVIARYGYAFRAIKPKLAAERGAIGCLIYSDPSDDGYVLGEAYPEGPYKNDSAVQRGSIKYTPLYAGDPLTPGWAATADTERLDITESKSLATIPTLPISYGDALPLLDAIEGPVAPPEWRGGLPITYRIGPGPATVRLQLAFDWNTVTAQNVIATRQGVVWPDQWIIRGNHHDAWTHGARDPVSGLISMLAEAKAISMLPAGAGENHRVRRLGRGGTGAHGLGGVGGGAPRRTRGQGCPLRQHGRHHAWLRARRRQSRTRKVLQRGAARCNRPANRTHRQGT